MDLKDKVAIVTGSSSGIGRAIAIALVNEGAKVVINSSKSASEGKYVVEDIKKNGGKATYIQADISDLKEVEKLFQRVKIKFQKLDILVNCAGIEIVGNDLEKSTWEKTFEVDVFGIVNCVNHSLKVMNGYGTILNISSAYGFDYAGYKDSMAYSAAKAAVNNFTKTLAKKLAPDILVNAIAPGYTDTPMWKNTSVEEKIVFSKDHLIERFVKPEEVAEMAIAILRNDAMTGEVVVVDGGLSLKTV